MAVCLAVLRASAASARPGHELVGMGVGTFCPQNFKLKILPHGVLPFACAPPGHTECRRQWYSFSGMTGR